MEHPLWPLPLGVEQFLGAAALAVGLASWVRGWFRR